MAIKLIIFDLDDTLLDTSSLLIPIAKTPAFFERIQKPLPLMEGAQQNLDLLKSKYALALLTYGNLKSQQQKVKSMGISNYFERMYFADPDKNENKRMHFERCIVDFGVTATEALSIGNRRSTDIREAKQVGLRACLFQYGEHSQETPQCPEDVPDFTVKNHRELLTICQL